MAQRLIAALSANEQAAVGAVMEFGVLGPVEVWLDGRAIDAGHARQRAVLAVLLLDPGHVVPVEAVIDRVWGEDPPRSVRNVVYGYVARLKALIAGAAAGQPADYPQALAWFEAEHQVLLAAVALAAGSGFDTHAWQLPWAMMSFLQARGHWQEWAATQRTALAAATRLGDAAAQALSCRILAMTCTSLGDHDQAHGLFASSLTMYQRLGDRLGEARFTRISAC